LILSFAASCRLVAPNLLHKPLGVLAADEHLERVAEREVRKRLDARHDWAQVR